MGATPITPEKRTVDWHHHSGSDLCGLGLAIDRDDTLEHTREFVRQRAGIRPLTVVVIVDRKIDLQDANLQRVAGLGTVNENRPGKDVSRRAAILDLAVNGTLIFRYDARQNDTGLVDLGRVERGRGLDRDDVAGIDRQHRFERRAEMTDVYGLRARHQGIFRAERIRC